MADIRVTVNGTPYTADLDPNMPLLYWLMDDLKLNGPKFGCGLSQCGACTVLMNGEPTRSCTTTCGEANAKSVQTIEGLGTPERPHPIQQAFMDEQAIQCGFCISGVMLTAKAFIDKTPNATREQILASLDGVVCRCYTHVRMIRALEKYARGPRA